MVVAQPLERVHHRCLPVAPHDPWQSTLPPAKWLLPRQGDWRSSRPWLPAAVAIMVAERVCATWRGSSGWCKHICHRAPSHDPGSWWETGCR